MRIVLAIGVAFALLVVAANKAQAVSLLLPFGGKIISISKNIDVACPLGTNIVTVGPPRPTVAIFTNAPKLVKNGPAKEGAWALGLTTPPAPPCLPVVTIMGVSKVLKIPSKGGAKKAIEGAVKK